jgi:hypothetical protein
MFPLTDELSELLNDLRRIERECDGDMSIAFLDFVNTQTSSKQTRTLDLYKELAEGGYLTISKATGYPHALTSMGRSYHEITDRERRSVRTARIWGAVSGGAVSLIVSIAAALILRFVFGI